MTLTAESIEKLQARVNPTLLKGLTIVCKEKPEDPVRFLANWLIENNPYRARTVDPIDPDPLSPFTPVQ
jgi:nucleoside-diphosphate kinase